MRQTLSIKLDHSQGVTPILSEVASENEFLKNVLAAVRIRKGMDESALRAHIAYSAGQSKTGSPTTGTAAVVEFLKRSGYLKEEDGKLVVGSPVAIVPSESLNQEDAEAKSASSRNFTQTIEADSPFLISIKIEVRCEPQDLDDLGSKLRKVVDDFSKQGADDANED